MKTISYYFLIFFIYSVLGWIMESTYVSIGQKKFVNRGFLIGPYCPIYGYGSLIMIIYLEQYKDNILTVFILGIAICSFLEYITSYLMEKIFKARWWDYSDKKFNLNGRVCGKNALLFGIGGLIVIYLVHPIIETLISKLNNYLILILSIIFFVIYIIDTIVSFNIVNKLKKNLSNVEVRKDSTQELKNLVSEIINNNINNKTNINIFQKRIINAFPDFDIKKFVKIRKKKIEGLFKKN